MTHAARAQAERRAVELRPRVPHELAQPSRIAAAMASEGRITRLLTVLDARSFLDDWESQDAFPPEQEAAKSDVRAHLHDRKARVILVEQIESADTIMLTHTEQADADEVEMMTAILQELNPSATVVAREGDGAVGSKVKFAPKSVKRGCSVSVKRGGKTRRLATASTGKTCGVLRRKIAGSRKGLSGRNPTGTATARDPWTTHRRIASRSARGGTTLSVSLTLATS